MRAKVLMGLMAGTLAAAPAAWAADAANPYGNVNHAVDAGNNTGDGQVDQLNQQELNRVAPGNGQEAGDSGSGGQRGGGAAPPGQGADGRGSGYAYGAAPPYPYPPPYYYGPRYAYPYPAPVVVARPWWGWRRPFWGPRFYYP